MAMSFRDCGRWEVRRAVAITDATVNPWAKALGLVEEGTPFSIWDIVPVWNRPDWDTKPEEDVMPTAPDLVGDDSIREGDDAALRAYEILAELLSERMSEMGDATGRAMEYMRRKRGSGEE